MLFAVGDTTYAYFCLGWGRISDFFGLLVWFLDWWVEEFAQDLRKIRVERSLSNVKSQSWPEKFFKNMTVKAFLSQMPFQVIITPLEK